MTDQTITLSYDERSALLALLGLARLSIPPGSELLEMRDILAKRVSRLECQPGGCPYCNADRAREESEYRDSLYAKENSND